MDFMKTNVYWEWVVKRCDDKDEPSLHFKVWYVIMDDGVDYQCYNEK